MVMLFCGVKEVSFRTWSWKGTLIAHLVGVGNPGVLGANIGDTLVLIPVVGLGERLIDHVVEVAAPRLGQSCISPASLRVMSRDLQIVREDDVSVEGLEVSKAVWKAPKSRPPPGGRFGEATERHFRTLPRQTRSLPESGPSRPSPQPPLHCLR